MEKLLGEEENVLVEDLRLSYSRVSSFDQDGPSSLVKRKELGGEGISIGGLVDLLLFEPKKFEDNYYIFKAKIPTATTKELADIIINNYEEVPSGPKVLKIVKSNNFWSSVKKEDVLIKKFDNDEFWGYLKASFESKGKEIIDVETLEWAESIVEVLKIHNHSKDIVAFPEENEDKYVQLELDFRYKQFVFRGILDLVIVNHTNKTIRLIDLKTGKENVDRFVSSFVKYRYYLQALLYLIGIKSFQEKYGLQEYSVLPFEFLYISRFQKIPMLYEVSDKWINAATNGFTTASGYEYRGLDQLLDDIDWHWTNKEFDLPRDIAEANGEVLINDDFITVK